MTNVERLTALQSTLSMNYLEIFDLDKDFTEADLKKQYRKLSRICHPDNFVMETEEVQAIADEVASAITHIYEVLSDEESRAYYIENGEELNQNKADEIRQAKKTAEAIEALFAPVPDYQNAPDGLIQVTVPIKTAYHGGTVDVTYEDTSLKLKIPKGTLNGTIFVFKEVLGTPIGAGRRGNLVVMVAHGNSKQVKANIPNLTVKVPQSALKFEDDFLTKVKVLDSWVDVSECNIDCNETGTSYRIQGKGFASTFYRSQGDLTLELTN